MFKITVKGDRAVINSLKNKRLNFQSIIETAVRVSGLQVEKEAKVNAPTKTGNLRRSILSVDSKKGNVYTARVGPDIAVAPYAIWVETGHAQAPGRYVPDINRRLVASWVEGKWYMARTGIQMKGRVENNLKIAFRRAII